MHSDAVSESFVSLSKHCVGFHSELNFNISKATQNVINFNMRCKSQPADYTLCMNFAAFQNASSNLPSNQISNSHVSRGYKHFMDSNLYLITAFHESRRDEISLLAEMILFLWRRAEGRKNSSRTNFPTLQTLLFHLILIRRFHFPPFDFSSTHNRF